MEDKNANLFSFRQSSTQSHDFSLRTDEEEVLCQLEFHVLFHSSFQVPVLYFNAHYRDGSLLSLEIVRRTIFVHDFEQSDDQSEMSNIITQAEHPILFKVGKLVIH